MKKRNLKPVMENVKRRWTRQIVQEKGYTQTTAIWMVERIEELIDWMQYGYAVIAYRRGY